MDFAKGLLKKYGWKEGDGLGRNSDGISEPLKANLKFDKSGLGVDKSAEFNNHWWKRVFNDAANNLDINKNDGHVEISVKSDCVEITTKEYSVKELKTGQDGYKHFVKTSVLNGLKGNLDESENEPVTVIPELPKYKLLTDEELFAACGGRTAHKGARHGLKLSGKLSRIEEQERELLQKMQNKVENIEDQGDWKLVTAKNKKRKRSTQDDSELQSILYTNEYLVKSKKKRKREKQLDNNLSSTISSVRIDENSPKDIMIDHTPDLFKNCKKKLKKKDAEECLHENESVISTTEATEILVKKKRKIGHTIDNVKPNKLNFLKSNDNLNVEQGSKKKKKKLKSYAQN